MTTDRTHEDASDSRDKTLPFASPENRPSLWAIAAGLVALGLLFAVCGGGVVIPLLALGLVGPLFLPYRLETDSYFRWIVRVALIALIYQISQAPDSDRNVSLAIGSTGLRALFGQLYGAEMVVQAWRRRVDGPYQSTLAVTLFSGLIFLTACNTFDDRFAALATPVYMLLVAFALRDWRTRAAQPRPGSTPVLPRQRALTAALRVGVLLLAIGVSAGAQHGIAVYKDALTEFGNRLLSDKNFLEPLGMSSEPQLGSTFGLRGSPERVLRVKNLVGDGHLRGATFDTYTLGGRWGPSLGQVRYTDATNNDLSPLTPVYGTRKYRSRSDMTITRLTNMPLLFAPVNTATITTADVQDKTDIVDWAPEAGGILKNKSSAPYEYIVSVADDSLAYQGPLCNPVLTNPTDRARYLQVPSVTDTKGNSVDDAIYMRNLSLHVTAQANTVPKKIAAITQYLISTHHYSLSTRIGPGDPVASFLREKKDAHCEFFAASSTLMLRYAGVPARYVTGYLAHERGTAPGETIVRQRDAHAWTEAWVDNVGWVPVDATPGGGRPDEMTMDPIGPGQRFNEWLQDKIQQIKDTLADVPPIVLNIIMILIALLPLVGYIVAAIMRARKAGARRVGTAFTYAAAQEELAHLAGRFEKAFDRAGRPFAPEKTYNEQLENTATFSYAESGRQFARLYDAARFGGRLDTETLSSLERLVDEIEREAATEKKKP